MIRAILACDETGGVSKDGTLPWPNNPMDLKWFKDNTAGHIVVMGSTTWKDPNMPRPLPKRKNILVTSKVSEYVDSGIDGVIQGDLNTHLKVIEKSYPSLITWVIGGPNIVEQSLGVIDEFYLSRIPGTYDCDTFLPLKKIETLFELKWFEANPEVTFEIWRKRETIS